MGKAACVLQGVLHAESTRDVRIKYIYVAFHNNRGRLFKASAVLVHSRRVHAFVRNHHSPGTRTGGVEHVRDWRPGGAGGSRELAGQVWR